MRGNIQSIAMAVCAALSVPSLAAAQDGKPAVAQPAGSERAQAQAPVPRLVVAISVDQFSADLFAQYRRDFSQGLARMQQGAVFPSGFQSHAATETCPGHSTMLTGVHPSRTGIVANKWFDPAIAREDKSIYCAEDERDPASSSEEPVVSATHLKVPTLGDRLKKAFPASINVAVSGKDRAAIMMGGHTLDAVYWWKGGQFVTLNDKTISPAAKAANVDIASQIAAGAGALPVPGFCQPRDRAVPVKDFAVGTYKFAVPAGNAALYGRTPYQDAAVGDLAVRLVDEMKLGADATPDVLSVSFSATDYVGHAYGTEGVEMCIQLSRLDATLGKLFAALDERGIDYVAMLTADHGGIDLPERLAEQGYPQATRLGADLATDALAARISRATGIAAPAGGLLLGGVASGDMYLSAGLSPQQKSKITAAIVADLRKHPQVAEVFTKAELAATPVPTGSPQDWTLRQRARASFDQDRSGDLVIMLARGVVAVDPHPGITTTHGSPWDYDRRVPILFWRKGLAPMEQPAPVETVDIAPTLAALVGLEVEAGAFDGRCLDIDGGTGDTCP